MHRVHGLAGGRDGYGRDGYGRDGNRSLKSHEIIKLQFPGLPHSITQYLDGFEPSTAYCRASDSFKVKLHKQERGFDDCGRRSDYRIHFRALEEA